jgi:hypothetical protein
LLAGGEYKFCAAIRALQDSIVVFHVPLRSLAWSRKARSLPACGKQVPIRVRRNSAEVNPRITSALSLRILIGTLDPASYRARLILLAALLLAQSLSRQRLFHTSLFSGLHVKAVPFNFLDDVFLLDFALESTQRILQGFTFLNCDFCQAVLTPIPWSGYVMKADSLREDRPDAHIVRFY